MNAFVLVPGAGGSAWYWHRVVPILHARGKVAVAVDLPGDDETAGLPEYRDRILAAIGESEDAVLVAQSMGAFSAVMACAQGRVRLLVLLNAMIPLPGETPGEWFENTGAEQARTRAARAGGYPVEFDAETYFLHDVPAEVAARGATHARDEAPLAFGQRCEVRAWPNVRTVAIAGRDDRFLPLEFQRRLARQRLASDTDVIPGGHLAALAQPTKLVDRLVAYVEQATR
jgi:pimeloyl-ACP methyl ester carboxylesterase